MLSAVRFAGIFLGSLIVLVSATFYVHRRASTAFGLSRTARRILGSVLAASLPLMVVGRALSRAVPGEPLRTGAIAGSVLALGVVISAILLGVVDAVRGLARIAMSARRRIGGVGGGAPDRNDTPPAAPVATTGDATGSEPVPRRTFLGQAAAGSALLVGSSSSLYGAFIGRHDYVIEEVVVRIPGLSRALDGFTIVQLSDLHIGQFVGAAELAAACALVDKARPDVLVLTGDLLDHDIRYAGELARFTRRLADRVARGVFAIPGNHDYYAGLAGTLAALEQGGARVLLNSGLAIGDAGGAFALLGVDDVWGARSARGGGPDLARALSHVPPDLPRVLLAHNPVFFPDAAPDVALQLSGHTHGGQVNFVVRPADLLMPYGYIAGLYERSGARLYVNRGFGTAGPPARIGSPPEVTRIVLVSA